MAERHSKSANKRQKEHGLLVLLNKAINNDCKVQGLDKLDFANEIGIASKGALENKLKKSKTDTDITLSEFIHILELTGDISSLEYLCHMFDYQMITTLPNEVTTESLHDKADTMQIECTEAFATVKKAIKDKKVTETEHTAMISELDDIIKVAMDLKQDVKTIKTEED